MDLLGGYSSSGSSNDDNDSDNENIAAETKVNGLNDSHITSIQSKIPENAESQIMNHNTSIAKQNKRLLSLNAVLPSEIYERLTRSMQQLDSSSEEDDDKDDEEYNVENEGDKNGNVAVEKSNRKTVSISFRNRKNKKSNNSTKNSKKVRNKGIQSLLDDLKSNIASNKKEGHTNDSEVKEEKMGLAFTNAVVTTIKKKKNDDSNEVISIHKVKPTKAYALPKNDDTPNKTITTSKSSVSSSSSQPFSPKKSTVSQSYTNVASEEVSSSNRVQRFIVKPEISAAPLVTSESSLAIPMYPTYAQPQSNFASISSNIENNQTNNIQPKKNKRQMQQALRSGNFSELSPNLLTSIPNPTLSSTSSMVIPTTGQQMSSSKYNISNADIYDPKKGQMVSVSSANSVASDGSSNQLRGKLRSKHQIHQLVQSARMLEANRRMQGSLGIGNSNANSRRADAKRKYGW